MRLKPVSLYAGGKRPPPSVPMWLRRVEQVHQMENLVMSTQNRMEAFRKTWYYWHTFLYSETGKSYLSGPADLAAREVGLDTS